MRGARRWVVPGLCVVFAAGYAAVFLANDRPLLAAIGAGVMLAYGLVLVLFSRRSEAVALLREDAPDERRSMIRTKAAASTCTCWWRSRSPCSSSSSPVVPTRARGA
jgi:hypothetical protein